jgi:hypothetical protein
MELVVCNNFDNCVTVWSWVMFCSSVSFVILYRVIVYTYWGESTGWRTILTALLWVVNNA